MLVDRVCKCCLLIIKGVRLLFCDLFSILVAVIINLEQLISSFYRLMKNIERTFQIISYLQYPFMLLALFYCGKSIYDIFALGIKDTFLPNLNTALMLIGIGVSFSALQDSTKTQNNFSKKIWQNKKKGAIALLVMTCMVLFFFVAGGIGYFTATSSILEEISMGLIVLGIGYMGLLSVAINMYKYQQSLIEE